MIKDSGSRHEFSTGAVRDIQDDKGRPTLMPLRVVARMLANDLKYDNVMESLALFAEENDSLYLYHALGFFSVMAYGDQMETMLLEVSKHYAEGCKKYGEDNWKKGIPVNCYLDSTIRHYLKYRRGDTDEPHDRAFVWNIMCCIWEVDYHHEQK